MCTSCWDPGISILVGLNLDKMDVNQTFQAGSLLLSIENLKKQDISALYDMVHEDNWPLTLEDLQLYHTLYPGSFFAAYREDGQLIGKYLQYLQMTSKLKYFIIHYIFLMHFLVLISWSTKKKPVHPKCSNSKSQNAELSSSF